MAGLGCAGEQSRGRRPARDPDANVHLVDLPDGSGRRRREEPHIASSDLKVVADAALRTILLIGHGRGALRTVHPCCHGGRRTHYLTLKSIYLTTGTLSGAILLELLNACPLLHLDLTGNTLSIAFPFSISSPCNIIAELRLCDNAFAGDGGGVENRKIVECVRVPRAACQLPFALLDLPPAGVNHPVPSSLLLLLLSEAKSKSIGDGSLSLREERRRRVRGLLPGVPAQAPRLPAGLRRRLRHHLRRLDPLPLGAPTRTQPRPPTPRPLVRVRRHGGRCPLLRRPPRRVRRRRDQQRVLPLLRTSTSFIVYYSSFTCLLIFLLLEAAVAGHLLLNEQWRQDLPYDRTGELDNLISFVHDNLDLCKWAALATFATQALSLLLAMVLRAIVSTSDGDYDSDEDFVVIRRPLLVAQGAPAYLPTTANPGAQLWSSSMRQKYGLNSSNDYAYNTLDHQSAVQPK